MIMGSTLHRLSHFHGDLNKSWHGCRNLYTRILVLCPDLYGLGGQILDVQQMFALVQDDIRRSHQTVMLVHHTLYSCTFHQFYDQPQTAGLVHLHRTTTTTGVPAVVFGTTCRSSRHCLLHSL